MLLVLLLSACAQGERNVRPTVGVAHAQVTSAPDEAKEQSGGESTPEPAGDTAYLYVGGLVRDKAEYTVQSASFFEELNTGYFLTAGGSFHYSNGSTLWAGSVLSPDSIRGTTDYRDGVLVAFTVKSALTGDALQAELEEFAASMLLYDGESLLESSHQIYTDEVVGLLFPTKALEGMDIWFRIGGDTVLAAR